MKKRTILIIVVVLLLGISAIPVTIKIQEGRRWKKPEELQMAFHSQNIAFAHMVNAASASEDECKMYMPICFRNPHIEGICITTYERIAFYRRETGGNLTYEQVIDYLSQEFEDDGEIRIYTNGRHPEIATYVEWINKYMSKWHDCVARMRHIYLAYAEENEPFPVTSSLYLPLEMSNEIAKKDADPDYEMDLASIQNRYIEEGRAIVSDDGKTIEFIVPEP